VASVQNTTLAQGGSAPTSTVTAQITPGTTVTGLTLYILPKILKDNIYLQINADLSTQTALQTFTTGGASQSSAGSTSIQLPTITEKHFNQRSMIKSGDTLILAGFRQVTNSANANQFLTSQALGGKGAQQLNKETIVLITPIVLSGSA
jgi:type II secretory pathway component GspD/PulD (secretin)